MQTSSSNCLKSPQSTQNWLDNLKIELCDDEELKLTSDTDEPLSGTVLEKRRYLAMTLKVDTMKVKKGPSSPEPKRSEHYQISKHYKIGKQLGIGTYSQVYEATCKKTGIKYAVKKWKGQTNIIRLQQEYEILKGLEHKNIPKVIEFKADERTSSSYLVMELWEGISIDQYIAKNGVCDINQSLKIIYQLCEAISYLHQNGICHRDVKPQNILIDENLNIKLIDFNISKVVKKMNDDVNPSRLCFSFKLMTQIGSPSFAAPEVYSSDWYTEKIDVWGIGIVLLYLLLDSDEIPTDFCQSDNFSKIECTYTTFLKRCLCLDPDTRYSAEECLTDELLNDFKPNLD